MASYVAPLLQVWGPGLRGCSLPTICWGGGGGGPSQRFFVAGPGGQPGGPGWLCCGEPGGDGVAVLVGPCGDEVAGLIGQGELGSEQRKVGC